MAVNNSIKIGPLVFLLQMFVITENIMKRPVCVKLCTEVTSIQAVLQEATATIICVGRLINHTYMEPLFSYSVTRMPICELCSVSWKLMRSFSSGTH